MNLSKEKKLEDAVNQDMILIRDTIEANHELEVMLKSPVIKTEVKKSALKKIFSKKVNGITMGLINLLIENKRLNLLPLVAREFIVIYDFLQGVELAQSPRSALQSLDIDRLAGTCRLGDHVDGVFGYDDGVGAREEGVIRVLSAAVPGEMRNAGDSRCNGAQCLR